MEYPPTSDPSLSCAYRFVPILVFLILSTYISDDSVAAMWTPLAISTDGRLGGDAVGTADLNDLQRVQCGDNFSLSSLLATASAPHNHALSCSPASLSALRDGTRAERDGPFTPILTRRGRPCSLRWYKAHEACAQVRHSARFLIFVGDSLTRHIVQALYTVLTGNFRYGGMQWWAMSADHLPQCECDGGYHDRVTASEPGSPIKICLLHTMASFAGPQSAICPTWQKNFIFYGTNDNIGYSLETFKPDILETQLERAAAEYADRALIILGIGLHTDLDSRVVFPRFHQKVIDAAALYGNGVQVLCLTVHMPQANKPEPYTVTQGPKAIREWNEQLTSFCRNAGADILDSTALTKNATSYDGTHYAASVNTVLAQALLNYLADLDGDV